MGEIIDGKKFAFNIIKKLEEKILFLKSRNIYPKLAVIIIGDDEASQIYVNKKEKKARQIGIKSMTYRLDKNIREEELLDLVFRLNNDQTVHAILIQLPLPSHFNKAKIINNIDPNKDVDGFNVLNVGKLVVNDPTAIIPCTPLGCFMLLKHIFVQYDEELKGKKACIVGRSDIVGKPMAILLLRAGCTITILHSATKNLEAELKTADIIVSATGIPNLIKQDYIKNNVVIIDVGINRLMQGNKMKIVGDVDFDRVVNKVRAITPVPGGVGPITISCLLLNTVRLAFLQNNLEFTF